MEVSSLGVLVWCYLGDPPLLPGLLPDRLCTPSPSSPGWILQAGCSLRLAPSNRCKPYCCQNLPEAGFSPLPPAFNPTSSSLPWDCPPLPLSLPPPQEARCESYLVFSTCMKVCMCVYGGVGWWGLIRMWDVPVEKQDLNKAGTNAQFCVAATFPPPPPTHPCPGCPGKANVATLISGRCCIFVGGCHWVRRT